MSLSTGEELGFVNATITDVVYKDNEISMACSDGSVFIIETKRKWQLNGLNKDVDFYN